MLINLLRRKIVRAKPATGMVLVILLLSGCAAYQRANLKYLEENIFAKIEKTILKPKCVKCHGGRRAPHGVRFESYENIVKHKGHHKLVEPFHQKESQLLMAVSTGKMPPKPREKLQEEDIALIKEWICRGTPRTGMGKEPSKECLEE